MEYEVIESAEDLGRIANDLNSVPHFGLDIETTGFDPRTCDIRLVQVSPSPDKIAIIDLFKTKTLGPVLDVIKDPSKIKIGQNLKFESKYFNHKYDFDLFPLFDTFRASSILYNGKDYKNGLYDLFSREIGIFPRAQDLGGSNWGGPLTKEQYEYAAEDVPHLHALRTVLRKKVIDHGLAKIAAIEFAVIGPEAECELNGFGFDKEAWIERFRNDEKELEIARKNLLRSLPSPFGQMALPGFDPSWNLASSDQMLKSLRSMGLKARVVDEATKQTKLLPIQATGEIDLAPFAAEYPIIKEIFRFRTLAKNVNTYGESYLDRINPITGRIHTDYWPFTAAGRYSCDLQQIPRDEAFRRCFGARKGRRIVSADYSAVELRIASEIAHDKVMMQGFIDNKDPHQQTGSLLSGKKYEDVTKAERQQSKPVNFGLIYGMGWRKLILYALTGYNVVLTDKVAQQYVKKFFETYYGLHNWHDVAARDAARTLSVRTMGGRVRSFKEAPYTEAFNTPVQGCLPSHTRILTKKGYQSIGDVRDNKHPDDLVWTGSAWKTFDIVDKGFWELAELQLDDGSVLPCDTRHEVLIMTDTGYEWKQYSALKEGDLICTSLCEVKEFDKSSDLPAIDLSSKTRNKPVSNVEANTSTFWYWIGRYFGDGWIINSDGLLSFVFGSHERDMAEACVEYWSRWSLSPSLKERIHTPANKESLRYVVEIYSADLCRWLESNIGIKQATAHTKRLPNRLFSESVLHRKCFMLGFMASDGYRPDPQEGNPNLHLCNRDLLLDTKLLLRTLGVESTLNGPYDYKGFTSWRLDVFYRMFAQLFEEQPIRSRIGMKAPAFLINEFIQKYDARSVKFSSTVDASNYQLVYRMRKGGAVSVYTLDSLCKQAGIILESPIYAYSPLKLKKETGVYAPTFTLAVHDELHRFDSEGIISKNTGADALKRALRLIYDAIKPYGDQMQLIHHVHDEILLEVDDNPDIIKEAKDILSACMAKALSEFLRIVPAATEAKDGMTWKDVK